jgi:hypothetical protein
MTDDALGQIANEPTVDTLLLVGQREATHALRPSELVTRHLENAQRQLGTAREQLIRARRRVVQFEEAVANWQQLRNDLLASEQFTERSRNDPQTAAG